jgi:hypothetical protein
VREFAFELALCAHVESERDAIVGRQLGTSCHGTRVMDVVLVEPGPEFDDRAAITPETIPVPAVESDVGPGRARYWKDAFDMHPDRAESVVDRAVDLGFFEHERRGGREYVRQTARYPDDWFDRLVGIENKPDLGRPGDLERQLRLDVSLGLLDEVVLATESYVTGAHLNRIPDEVGVWRFDPATGEREVVREPTPLDPDAAGVDILDSQSGRTDIAVVEADAKTRQRRRVAERAYGKGWRVADLPGCVHAASGERFGAGCLPDCEWKGRLVDPASECGADCDGFEPTEPPAVDVRAERDRRQPWRADPDGTASRQSGLHHFSE